MNKKLFLYAALIGSIFFMSCGKYDEGPLISIIPKKARVVNTWEIEKVMKNGKEIDIADSLFNNFREYKKDGSMTFYDLNGEVYQGEWEFYDKKKYIISNLILDTGVYVEKGRILKLKQKELWLEVDYTAYKWELHFKEKGN